MLIYKLTFPNGKSYIGQTMRTLEGRMADHRRQANAGSLLPVHCAWRKHGAPVAVVLGEYADMPSLHAAEIDAIKACGTLAPGGYNVGYGGETAPSKNPDVAAKIAAKAVGRLHTDEVKSRLADSTRALWATPEYREKVDAAVRASWTDEKREAARTRLVSRMAGVPKSEAHKAKLRSYTRTEETRAKMSASAKARIRVPMSDASKAKLSASIKATHSQATGRGAAISKALKARYENMTTAQREALSDARKRAWATRRAVANKGAAE